MHYVLRRLYQSFIAWLIKERYGHPGAAGICIDNPVWCRLIQTITPHLHFNVLVSVSMLMQILATAMHTNHNKVLSSQIGHVWAMAMF